MSTCRPLGATSAGTVLCNTAPALVRPAGTVNDARPLSTRNGCDTEKRNAPEPASARVA